MTLDVESPVPNQAGQVQVVADVAMDPIHTLSERETRQAAQIGAYINVLLVKQQQWVITLRVHSIQARSWTSSEVELV
ncbi:hypothetical protein [Spirosoma agri]|uniref:Uncharacterized protein n=1 Tax=Spirosoma agri TaxID=1987381 RepID=A0A6M0IQP9_9BACT|nr:hypothetical protein [Spirosoma agri]NEU70394.1 hypothetical protein [Spirosoma agri]